LTHKGVRIGIDPLKFVWRDLQYRRDMVVLKDRLFIALVVLAALGTVALTAAVSCRAEPCDGPHRPACSEGCRSGEGAARGVISRPKIHDAA
jgi:hypothetical protein